MRYSESAYREAAFAGFYDEDEVDIDLDAQVSECPTTARGCCVQAWVWVSDEDVAAHEEYMARLAEMAKKTIP